MMVEMSKLVRLTCALAATAYSRRIISTPELSWGSEKT
jgi:hypothetical protein